MGFGAGIIARLLSPGPHNLTGFILTPQFSDRGAFIATFVGQANGHDEPDQGARFVTSMLGAPVLIIWHQLVVIRNSPSDEAKFAVLF